MRDTPTDNLAAALRNTYPELDAVRGIGDAPVFLVGGAVRDLLLGRDRSDIDLVVVGDAGAVAARLGAEVVEHERFATAKVQLDGHEVDIATARAESYPHPGALPVVEPADEIATDLARRDFTINAIAIPLQGEPELVDPHGGRDDLDAGRLRVLHPRSLIDDPTRALRAARYAARFGFQPEAETEALLRAADLESVSSDRREADLLRLAAEPAAVKGFELLAEWGLVEPRPDGLGLAERVARLLSEPPWDEVVPRDRAVLSAALGPPGVEEALAAAAPGRPSEAVELARTRRPVELVLARALGAEWLDRYLAEWRAVELEIGGTDLIAAGVPEGPAVGRGLAEALRRKLDGELTGREQELEVALDAAGGSDGVA
jgi:tRNA nucleotidyltransferase (CCA-adding enzyme)